MKTLFSIAEKEVFRGLRFNFEKKLDTKKKYRCSIEKFDI